MGCYRFYIKDQRDIVLPWGIYHIYISVDSFEVWLNHDIILIIVTPSLMGREDEVIELKKQLHLIEDSIHVLCEERKQ